MDPMVASAAISAGASIAGKAYDAIAGGKNNHAGRDQRQATSYANYSAIADKVRAAKDMGIHPLYALGAPTISAASAVGGGDSGPSLGETFGSMGQDISRAVAAGQTQAERDLQRLTLEKAGLENEYLRSQIASVNNRTVRESAPPFPSGVDPTTKVNPPEFSKAPHMFGVQLEANPHFGDFGQWSENRHAENNPLGWLGGSVVAASDMYWNSTIRKAIMEIQASSGSSSPSAARQILDYLWK